MGFRTTQTVVRFSNAFVLPGFDGAQPPGDYRIDYDEEPFEGASRTAWLRVRSYIHLPAIGRPGTVRQMVPILAAELDTALELDRKRHEQ